MTTAEKNTHSGKGGRIQSAVAEWAVVLVIVALFWAARYWHAASFGLYEDDLTIIPGGWERSFPDLLAYLNSYYIGNFSRIGHPMHFMLIYLLSYAGHALAGLQGVYAVAFLIEAANILLAYSLFRRLSGRTFAVLGALAYALFSADTTQAFLTHALGIQPAVTLLLLGTHAYLSDRKAWTFVCALAVLFIYETTFPVFLALPLLRRPWSKRTWHDLLLFGLILAAMLGGSYLMRSLAGEKRVSSLDIKSTLLLPFEHMLQGPFVSLGSYLLRPYQALKGLTLEIGLAAAAGFAAIAALVWRLPFSRDWGSRAEGRKLPSGLADLLQLLAAGTALLVLAYPMTFTVRAYAITGRDTRVHSAAVLGAALVVAVVLTLLFTWTGQRRLRKSLLILTALVFALVFSYGFSIQQEYVAAWKLQQQLWTEIVRLAPDAGENTVILVEAGGLQDTRQIGANTWNLPRILNQLYRMPAEWKSPPRVYRLVPHWEDNLVTDSGAFRLDFTTVTAPPSLYGEAAPENVIFLDSRSGQLARRDQPLPVAGQSFALKPAGAAVLPQLPRGLLFDLLVPDGNQP
ncbi:MAG: hypothetical protein GYA20_06320 [Chloroflexi bacterium]|nr:hypothetical protein [Chloroflexota bacterium]